MDQDQSLQRRRALSFLAFGVASFGISGVLIKLCRFPPPVVASFRMILAGAVLAPFCVPAWRRLVSRGGALEVMLLLVPGVLLGLHFHAFVAGLEHTSVASGTFLFSINPVFFALGERFLRRRQVPLHALASLGLVVAGAGWLFVVDHGGLGAALGGSAGRGGSLPGDLLCLLSTLLFVLYLFVSRWVTGTRRAFGRRGEGDDGSPAFPVPHHLYIHIVYLGGGLLTLPLAVVGGQLGQVNLADGGSLLALAGLALFPTLIGHTANNYGVRFLPPLTVSFFTLGEPVLAAAAAAAILGEVPSLRELPAYLLLLGATVHYLARSRSATCGRRKGSCR